MALRTKCKGFAKEGSGGINVFRMVLNITSKAGKRKVGEGYGMVNMADRILVQNQLKMLHCIVQVRDHLARYVCGKLYVARMCLERSRLRGTRIGVSSTKAHSRDRPHLHQTVHRPDCRKYVQRRP